MRITPKVRRFLMGGEMAPEAPMEQAPMLEAPMKGAPAEQQDPMMMLIQAAQQALQSQDCQMMAQVCQALVQIGQQIQGGAPTEEAPSEPVFARRGCKVVRRVKKSVRK